MCRTLPQTVSVVVTFLAAGLLLSRPGLGQALTADLILSHGRVFTALKTNPAVEAVAIRGDRIVAIGTSAEIEKLAGAGVRRINLRGRLVLPGFNDAHYHFGVDPRGSHLMSFKTLEPSWEEIHASLKHAVEHEPVGTWIFGAVGHRVVLDEKVDRFALDLLAPRHPVLLRAYYGHGWIVNSIAMPLLQIAEDEADPAGGFHERIAGSNRINGRLWEYAAWKPSRILAERVSDEDAVTALKSMSQEAVHFGVTSMQVFPQMPIERFCRLLFKADLPIRVRAIPFSRTTPGGRDRSEIRQLGTRDLARTETVVASGIKWVLDGTPYERGAVLRRDYHDRAGWRGRPNFSREEVAAMLRESLSLRQPLLLHAVGDHTVATLFDAMDRFPEQVDWPAKRVRIEHGDGVIEDLLPRAHKLGVVVVQNPSHFGEPELFHERWGDGYFSLRALLDAGIPLAIGSDGPLSPFLNIMFAITHPYNPRQAITREDAVIAYTQGSAFAEFAEDQKGVLAPGMYADLAVLSQDVFAVAPPALSGIRSVMTIVGGKIVHDEKEVQ
jgi:predicted amidohydrolase YtcJ